MAYLTDHLILAIGRCDSPEKLEETLAKFFTEYSALELLDERLGSSDEALASCASKSYVHVNGFQKLVIAATSTSGPQIRLHRWIGASQRSHIHDHSWHFASLVLKGRLEVSDFLEVDEGSQVDMYLVPNLERRNQGAVVQTISASCSMKCIEERIVGAGTIHGLRAGRFHAVQGVDPVETATLLFQSHHQLPCSRIVLSRSEALPNPYAVSRVSKHAFVDSLRSLRRSIAADADAQPCVQPDLAHKAAQGRLP